MNDYKEYILASKSVADHIKSLEEKIKELEEQIAQYQALYEYKYIVM